MTPAEIALQHARIHRRFGLFRENIEAAVRRSCVQLRHYNRHLDLWFHYLGKAHGELPAMTMRKQLEALGWTRRDGQTVRKSDGARPAYVACHPAVSQVQQWIICGCPADEKARAA